jgi:branched-chain amino acid transport system ATP-binding protein
MLTVKNVHSFYGVSHVLQGVSLEIKEGEVVCLIGRNGAGKSTTLKSIIGLVPPKKGSVQFKGVEISGMRPYLIARRGIGYVPEDRRIFPHISVRDNLLIGEKEHAHMIGKKWTLEKIFEFFPILEKLQNQKGMRMSGGEQQMLTIARTLMGNPELILLDEISEGLAPIIVHKLISLIGQLKEETTIFLVEQNAIFAFTIASRGYVIDKGKITYEGTVQELKDSKEVQDRYLSV